MPGIRLLEDIAPDAVDQLKKGFGRFLHRNKSNGPDGEGSGDAHIPTVNHANPGAPVEAPADQPTKTPQLTTTIPGSSLGPETYEAGSKVETSEAVPVTPGRVDNRSYAEGMSATSGPLGSSLEEVEDYEKLVERRSSVKSDDRFEASSSSAPAARVADDAASSSGKTASAKAARSNPQDSAPGSDTTAKRKQGVENSQDPPEEQDDLHEHSPGEGVPLPALNKAEQEV